MLVWWDELLAGADNLLSLGSVFCHFNSSRPILSCLGSDHDFQKRWHNNWLISPVGHEYAVQHDWLLLQTHRQPTDTATFADSTRLFQTFVSWYYQTSNLEYTDHWECITSSCKLSVSCRLHLYSESHHLLIVCREFCLYCFKVCLHKSY